VLLTSAALVAACTSSGSTASSGSSTGSNGSATAGSGYQVSTSGCNDPASATKKITGGIKLGYSVALSGPVAPTQAFIDTGIKARIAVANDHGGVAGHKLDATFMDDAYTPQLAKQNIDRMIQQGYDVLLTTGAGQLAAVAGDQNAACVPLLDAQVSDPAYRNTAKYPWTTEYLPSTDVEFKILAKLIEAKFPGGVKVGIAQDQSDTGVAYVTSFKAAIKGSNVTIASVAPTTSPADAAATLKASGAQVLLNASVAANCLNIPLAVAKSGWKPKLEINPSACADANIIYKAGGAATNGMLVLSWLKEPTNPSFATDPTTAQFSTAVKALGGNPGDAYTVMGWTIADLQINAMAKAAASKQGLTRASIMNVARTQQYQPPLFISNVKWSMNPATSLGITSFQPLIWNSASQAFTNDGAVISGT
jgi:branched-chain amino acid transport system substrate-binding protein